MKEEKMDWKAYLKKNADNFKLGGIVLGVVGICGVIVKVINSDSADDISSEE